MDQRIQHEPEVYAASQLEYEEGIAWWLEMLRAHEANAVLPDGLVRDLGRLRCWFGSQLGPGLDETRGRWFRLRQCLQSSSDWRVLEGLPIAQAATREILRLRAMNAMLQEVLDRRERQLRLALNGRYEQTLSGAWQRRQP